MKDLVLAEVKRAARLIDTGLWSFGLAVQGHNGRESLRVAAQSANEARKQVISAMKQAREAWRQMVIDAHQAEQRSRAPPRAAQSDPAERAPRRAPGRPRPGAETSIGGASILFTPPTSTQRRSSIGEL